MFFRRSSDTSPSQSDKYTAFPKGSRDRTRRTSTPARVTYQPRLLIKPRSISASTPQPTAPPLSVSPSSYESQPPLEIWPSAAPPTKIQRFSHPGILRPSSSSYPTASTQPYPKPHPSPSYGNRQRIRFPSLPNPLPAEVQAQVDIQRDRMARTSTSGSSLGPSPGGPRRIIRLDDPPHPALSMHKTSPTSAAQGQRQYQPGVPGHHRSSVISARSDSSISTIMAAIPESHPPPPVPAPGPRINSLPPSSKIARRASVGRSDPLRLLENLQRLLSATTTKADATASPPNIHDHLDVDDLLAVHERDLMDRDGRDTFRARLRMGRPGDANDALAVFGVPLRQVSMYASHCAVVGGKEHELPIVVFNCVEELYRTGIYQPSLFRALPNRPRLLKLISIFDSQQTHFGARLGIGVAGSTSTPIKGATHIPLGVESTADVCALLSTYISALPEPVLSPQLFDAVWAWCIGGDSGDDASSSGSSYSSDDEGKDEMNDARRFHTFPRRTPLRMAASRSRGVGGLKGRWKGKGRGRDIVRSEDELKRIAVAQALLRLLPLANYSLLVYLLAFFSQVGMMCDENGVGFEDLGRMFGEKIFGGHQSGRGGKIDGSGIDGTNTTGNAGVEGNQKEKIQARKRGDLIMCWFLERWGEMSEGLDFEDGAVTSKELSEKEVIGKRTVSMTDGSGLGSGLGPGAGDEDRHNGAQCANEAATMQPPLSASAYASSSGSLSNSWTPSRDYPGDALGRSPVPLASEPRSGSGSNIAHPSSWSEGDEERDGWSVISVRTDGNEKPREKERDGDSIHDIGGEDSVVLMPSSGSLMDTLSARTNTESELTTATEQEAASVYSSTALDERLLDLALPPPIDDSLGFSSPGDGGNETSSMNAISGDDCPTPRSRESSHQTASLLAEANRHIKALERELERNDIVVTDAIQETWKARDTASMLEKRVRELEGREGILNDWSNAAIVMCDKEDDEVKRRLQVAVQERDEAWKVVGEIRKLMGAGRK